MSCLFPRDEREVDKALLSSRKVSGEKIPSTKGVTERGRFAFFIMARERKPGGFFFRIFAHFLLSED